MTTFTIDSDNGITAHAAPSPDADRAQSFASAKELTKLTADWPAARLADIWNGFAGAVPFDDLKPVKKFKDRTVAVTRIWQAVQRLAPAAGQPTPQEAPAATRSRQPATKARRRATGPDNGQHGRAGSKKAEVLELLRRKQGATLAEIMKATGWQAHTVRGFISIVSKKEGITIDSSKNESGNRVYRSTK